MKPGHYTELFFLDEATALAAGHRPCAECQRNRFNQFREIWARANPEITSVPRPAATAIDAILHQERIAPGAQSRKSCRSADDLPDGTFVTDDEEHAYLVLKPRVLLWTPSGYERQAEYALTYPARVLTPASVVRTLASGYPVSMHPSALRAIAPSR